MAKRELKYPTKYPKKTYNIGDDNPSWKGKSASYSAVHKWVNFWKGSLRQCEVCGTTSAKKYEWINIDHKYRRVLDDYIRACTSCHRRYDYKFLKG